MAGIYQQADTGAGAPQWFHPPPAIAGSVRLLTRAVNRWSATASEYTSRRLSTGGVCQKDEIVLERGKYGPAPLFMGIVHGPNDITASTSAKRPLNSFSIRFNFKNLILAQAIPPEHTISWACAAERMPTIAPVTTKWQHTMQSPPRRCAMPLLQCRLAPRKRLRVRSILKLTHCGDGNHPENQAKHSREECPVSNPDFIGE